MERIVLPKSVYPKVKIVHKAKLNRPIFGLVLKNAIYKGFSSNKVKNSDKNSCLERFLNGANMPILRLIISLFLFTVITSTSLSQSDQNYLKHTNQAQLEKLEQSFRQQQEQELKRAQKIIENKGLQRKYQSDNGQLVELQGIDATGQLEYYTTNNLGAAHTVATNEIWPNGTLNLNLNGQGLIVGEWDGGAIYNAHQDLNGRINQVDGSPSISSHATHVAGTMIGAGMNNQARGMANQAELDAYDWLYDEAEMANAAKGGLLVSNHSYAYLTGWSGGYWMGNINISTQEDYKFGFYNQLAKQWDQIAYNAPYYLIVKAAGNDRGDNGPGFPADGPYDCIPPLGNAKNILTVGAVNDIANGYNQSSDVKMTSYSSWGPTDDGRIKPDIVANGSNLTSTWVNSTNDYKSLSGTSMASPNATGSLILLQEHYKNLYNFYMRAATLKGLVIHTADEAGSNPGPDYQYGWGLLNTAKAAAHISNDSGKQLMYEDRLANQDTFTYSVYSDGNEPLTATLSWTDVPGNPPPPSLDPSTLMLVNDLDLRIVYDSNNNANQPYVMNPSAPAAPASTGDNIRDNAEKVHIASPSAGWYTIRVTHKNNLNNQNPQEFSVISSGGVPACSKPSNLKVDGVTFDSAHVNWNSNDPKALKYILKYGAAGFSPDKKGNALIVDEGKDTALTSLSPGQAYEMYVKAVCSNGDTSAFTGPVGFSSKCKTASLPSLHNFSSTFPNCWSRTSGNEVTTTNACGNGSGYTLQLNGAIGAEAVTNVYDMSAYNSIQVTYDYRAGSNSNCGNSPEITDHISVDYWNGIKWKQLTNYSGGTAPTTFTPDSFSINSGLTDSFKLRFNVNVGSGAIYDNWNFDNLKIKVGCLPANNLTVDQVGANHGNVKWSPHNTNNDWQLLYKTKNDSFSNGTLIPGISDTNYTITNLKGNTSYDVYVREICGLGDTSTFIGPVSFTTDCEIKSTPYIQPFDDGYNSDFPNCWNKVDKGNQVILVDSTDQGVAVPTQPNVFELKAGNLNNSDTALLVTPELKDLGNGTKQVKFKAAKSGGGISENLIIGIINDPEDASTFTAYDTIKHSQLKNSFQEYTILLNDTGRMGNGNFMGLMHGTGSNKIYLDDFSYECIDVNLSPLTDLCSDASSIVLNGGPVKGFTYDGPGVNGNKFNPTIADTGNHDIYYHYNDDQGCSDTASASVAVNKKPKVVLDSMSEVCKNTSPLNLTSGSPSGGTYHGSGLSGNIFDPSAAGVDTHNITYTYKDQHGCKDTAMNFITVKSLPTVKLNVSKDLCANETRVVLNAGNPAGGTYLVDGENADGLDSQKITAGNHKISYSYNKNGCTDTASQMVTVHDPQPVSLNSFSDRCANEGSLLLNHGKPSGGNYWGVGVTDSLFKPDAAGVGDHSISYTYTDSNGCRDTGTRSIKVKPAPDVSLRAFKDYCTNDSMVELKAGLPIGGSYSGKAVTNNRFDPSLAGAGSHDVAYTYSDSNNCTATVTQSLDVYEIPSSNFTTNRLTGNNYQFVPNEQYHINYDWHIQGGLINQVKPKFQFANPGVYSIKLTVTNNKECSSSKIKSVDVAVGIANQSRQKPEFDVYPNPFKEAFQVEYSLRKSRSIQLGVFDGHGKRITGIVKERQTKGKYQHRIQPGNYDIQTGMFLIRLVIDGETYERMVIRSR